MSVHMQIYLQVGVLELLQSLFSHGFPDRSAGTKALPLFERQGCDLWRSILYVQSHRLPNIERTDALGSICKGLHALRNRAVSVLQTVPG